MEQERGYKVFERIVFLLLSVIQIGMLIMSCSKKKIGIFQNIRKLHTRLSFSQFCLSAGYQNKVLSCLSKQENKNKVLINKCKKQWKKRT